MTHKYHEGQEVSFNEGGFVGTGKIRGIGTVKGFFTHSWIVEVMSGGYDNKETYPFTCHVMLDTSVKPIELGDRTANCPNCGVITDWIASSTKYGNKPVCWDCEAPVRIGVANNIPQPQKPPAPKVRWTKNAVADFYNNEFLPTTKRERFIKDFDCEPDVGEDGMTKVKPEDLSMPKTWKCEDSPTNLCVYDMASSMGDDECIFCGQPEERK